MDPIEPPEESLFSKALAIGALAILLIILGACVYVIYGYVSPPPGPGVASPTPTPSPAPTPEITPTPTPAASMTPTPTVQICPTPEITPTPTPVYQSDVQVTSQITVMPQGVGIWDKYIVYDEGLKAGFRVHLYNIQTRADVVIAAGNVRSYGCIGSGKVGLVYNDSKITLYDIQTKTEVQASVDTDIPRMYPYIFGNQLIYTGNDGATVPVYSLYDYEFDTTYTNSYVRDVPEPNEPRADGDYVVWWYASGSGSTVTVFDRSNSRTSAISPAGAASDRPRISGKAIVYHSVAGGTDHVYLYDIASTVTTQVASTGMQFYADVYGNLVVYDNNKDGVWDIYLYDRSTKQVSRLTTEPHDQMMPQIYGRYVVYRDNRNYTPDHQGWDLYLLNI